MKCPNCSADLVFNIDAQVVKCEYCGSEFKAEELHEEVKKAKKEKEPQIKGSTFLCSQCGAKLMVFEETAATFCSYCGSQEIIKEELEEKIKPDYIIPFKIKKEQAVDAYLKKVKRFIFAPRYLSDAKIVQNFRGIFMPYSVYKIGIDKNIKLRGSVYYTRKGNYDYYHDYEVKMDVDTSYDGISYDVSSKYSDKYSQAVRHNIKDAVDFNPNYLAGFYVDTKDVDPLTYIKNAREEVEGDFNNKLLAIPIVKKHGVTKSDVKLESKEIKSALFPVYFMSFVDKDGKHIHYAVVNAQTGDVTFEIPVSFTKYLIFAAILTVPIYIMLDLFFVFKAQASLTFILIMSFITLILSNVRLNKIYRQENNLDDAGMTSPVKAKRMQKTMPLSQKILKYFIKQIIAICVCALGLLIDIPYDPFYYSLSIIGFIMILLSIKDLIKEHNQLTMRKILQLDKRGGNK